MTVGTSTGQTYEDQIKHLTDNPMKLGANFEGEGSDMEGPYKPLREDQIHIQDLKDLPPDWKAIETPHPEDPRSKGYRITIPKPAQISENTPSIVPGQGPTPLQPYDPKALPKIKAPSITPKGDEKGGGGFVPGSGARIGQVDINTDYNVKSGAIASKDSDTVYIDPKIPAEFHPFLAEHENVEKSLMAPPRSLSYDKAHRIATLHEKDMVEAAGMDWKKYTDAVDPYVAEAEKGKGNPPPGSFQVPIEDAIGHHASSAKSLEVADLKIGKQNA